MDGKKEDDKEKVPPLILKEYKRMARRERYLYERDKGRLVRFDDKYITSNAHNEFIEDLIIAKNMHIALNKALNDLSEDEYKIISECFYESGKRINYSKLAKRHGISRQGYTQNLKRILKKLKRLVVYYYNKL